MYLFAKHDMHALLYSTSCCKFIITSICIVLVIVIETGKDSNIVIFYLQHALNYTDEVGILFWCNNQLSLLQALLISSQLSNINLGRLWAKTAHCLWHAAFTNIFFTINQLKTKAAQKSVFYKKICCFIRIIKKLFMCNQNLKSPFLQQISFAF